MHPIFKEYGTFLKDKTGLDIPEGYYWYDKSIIKAFDKDGNMHKIYRLKINDDLSMSYSIPKGYHSVNDFEIASWSEIVQLHKADTKNKENAALELIYNKMKQYKDHTPIIPISTGKDSMVVLNLVRQLYPSVKAIFNNTSLDCADTYKMVKTIDNCEIMNPQKGFYQYVQDDKMIPTRFSRFCCRIFKTGVMVEQLNHDTKYLLFMGMRNDESSTRANYQDEWINETEWGNTQWLGVLSIREWSELDVWLYILMNNIPINPKYKKGYSRVGCAIACPYYTKSTWVLDDYWYPQMRQRWLSILSDDFVEEGKWNILNCTLEEYVNTAWNGGRVRDEPTDDVIEEFMNFKHIQDKNIAIKYFNNSCYRCGKRVKKDEVGLSMKYFGRHIEKMMCYKCLGKELERTKDELKQDVIRFKRQGCALF